MAIDTSPAPLSAAELALAERAALWKAAIKLPMYTVAVTPILVGSCAAYSDTGALDLPTLALFLAAAVCIIAWLNCTNDVFDFDTGIDENKRESVVNLLGATADARGAVLTVANALLAVGFAALAGLSARPSFDPTVLAVIALAVCGGYAYQGPPFRLGYYGLGEPITFVTWYMSVCAAYYSQLRLTLPAADAALPAAGRLALSLSRLSIVAVDPGASSLPAAAFFVALPTTIILFCSHFHQVKDDAAAGKKSPIVRLGTARASSVLISALVLMYVLQGLAWITGALPFIPLMFSLITIPLAQKLASFVTRNHAKPALVRNAKYVAVKLHILHGLSLASGFVATGYIYPDK
jgi:2-carboxy-1,4-naphthoquinone phytyltransferase